MEYVFLEYNTTLWIFFNINFDFHSLPNIEFGMYDSQEQPLFLAKDVAEWIEHTNPAVMISKVDEEEKELIVCDINNVYTTSKARKTQESWFLTEDGFYKYWAISNKR